MEYLKGILWYSSRATEVNTDKHQQGQLISRLKLEAGTSRISFLDIIKFSVRVLAAWRLNYGGLEDKNKSTLREGACNKLLEEKCFELFDQL